MSNRLPEITLSLAIFPLGCTDLASPNDGLVPGVVSASGAGGSEGTGEPAESSASEGEGDTSVSGDGETDGGEETQGGGDSGDTEEPGGPGEVHKFMSVQGLYNYVIEHEITNVRDLLSALPPSMGQSYVLMEETRSRHQSDVEHPRLIMYGVDAQFLLSVGGVPSDPIYEVLEMAEVDSQTGEWNFRAIDFQPDPPTLSENDDGCRGCHGTPARPIWGRYPEWPGAFANDDHDLTDAQVSVMLDWRENQSETDRYHHLELPTEHSLATNKSFYLLSRAYGHTNTVFNFELGMAHSEGLVRRMTHHEDWDTLKYELLNAHWCDQGSRYEILEKFGLSGANDFQLKVPVTDAVPGVDYDAFEWNHGSTGLVDIVVFLVLDEIIRVDPTMAEAVAAVESKRSSWIEYLFELEGDARAEWLTTYSYLEFDLRPQELLPPVKDQICEALASR